jgi:N-acyl-L-homoserine lactone synthetase
MKEHIPALPSPEGPSSGGRKDDEVIESATIWECSRIARPPRIANWSASEAASTNVLAELLVGIGDVARLAGLTQIVAVFDARVFRILEAGCRPEIFWTPPPNRRDELCGTF